MPTDSTSRPLTDGAPTPPEITEITPLAWRRFGVLWVRVGLRNFLRLHAADNRGAQRPIGSR